MSLVILMVPSLSSRDAIGHDVIESARLLEEMGHKAVLATANNFLTDREVLTIAKAKKLLHDPKNTLIYHHGIGWPVGIPTVLEAKCQRVICYHNVTPAHFFVSYSPELSSACELGRSEIRQVIAKGNVLYIGDSEYNSSELLEMGAPADKVVTVPPFHVVDHLLHASTDPKVAEEYGDGSVNILCVGRLVPNKGHSMLIEAFAAYHHLYNKKSRLILIGKEDNYLRDYSKMLRDRVRDFNVVNNVVFAGGVTEEGLKSHYELADIFMITSEHEGFCVPLVEAMGFHKPIIALGSSAIPGTLGGTGIVWEEFDPILFAESIHTVETQPQVKSMLQERGRKRYETVFSGHQIGVRFKEAMSRILK
jgi:glycosyltransferase involved in cell wall biosynthesis